MITARFYVESITRRAYNLAHSQVVLQAAGRGVENKPWAEATPSGKIEMTITNPGASDWFTERIGCDVALTFEDIDRTVRISPHSPE